MKSKECSGCSDHSRKSSRNLCLLIVISLIAHIIFVYLFIEHGYHKRALSWLSSLSKQLSPEQKQKQIAERIAHRAKKQLALQSLKKYARERPAQLRAPKSNFGWVMFEDPAQKPPDPEIIQQIPTTLDGPVAQTSVAQATEEKPQPAAITQKEEKKDFIKPQESTIPVQIQKNKGTEDIQHEVLNPQKHKTLKTIEALARKEDIPAEIIPAHTNTTIITPPPQQNLDPKLQQTKETQSNNAAKELQEKSDLVPPQEAEEEKTATIHVRGAHSIDKKPTRNIIALTKGFIEKTFGEEGTDLIDRDGDPHKKPSLEELKYLSYESKLSWCLQAAWKQNFCYRRMKSFLDGDVSIQFSIDEYGNLIECSLVQTSGNVELDNLVIKSTKIASPFPPIPKHFGKKTYTTGRVIQVRSNKFGA